VPLIVAPTTRRRAFSTGIGSPVTIDSSTCAAALEHDPIHRHLLARPHPQPVADLDTLERHILLGAIGRQPPRALGREPEQRLDRRAGLAARAQLEHLPEQDKVTITAAASK
jgi:hypothetical protein